MACSQPVIVSMGLQVQDRSTENFAMQQRQTYPTYTSFITIDTFLPASTYILNTLHGYSQFHSPSLTNMAGKLSSLGLENARTRAHTHTYRMHTHTHTEYEGEQSPGKLGLIYISFIGYYTAITGEQRLLDS